MSTEQEIAFEKSKKLLIDSEPLVHFDTTKRITVEADSSAYGVGGVLCHNIDGTEQPICFVSRMINTAERGYSQLEKEALAIVFVLIQFYDYIRG